VAALLAVSVWLGAPRRVEAPMPVATKPTPKPAPVVQATRVAPPVVKATATPPRKRRRREVTTRFYPLQYADATADLRNGPIVRVQVPRATLGAFGLPFDQDRADPVQADVALDFDTGMARAIRFVRAGN
jgi:hypothetical protein